MNPPQSLDKVDKATLQLGMRVQSYTGLTGTIRWKGNLESKDHPPEGKGFYLGVEFDEATFPNLRSDGTLNGKQYFKADPAKGLFAKAKNFFPEINPQYISALRKHYGNKVDHWHDFQLVKFCIARNYDMTAIQKMLDDHLEWEKTFKPSTDEYFPDKMIEDYPCGYSGAVDYNNNLIYCERPGNGGKCTPSQFVQRYEASVITRWHASAMEMGKKLMSESDYKYKRVCYIVDLTAVSVTMNRSLIIFARTVATLDQANYPEHLARLFLVNCPALFRIVWKMFRVFIDERTTKKVIFAAPNNGVELLKPFMREEDIPDFAGGPSAAWRKHNCRIGSSDPSKTFKGETVFQTVPFTGDIIEIDETRGDPLDDGDVTSPNETSQLNQAL